MIQLKATCIRCGGMGFIPANPKNSNACPNCEGKGTLVLTSQDWNISLERVPPFIELEDIVVHKTGGVV